MGNISMTSVYDITSEIITKIASDIDNEVFRQVAAEKGYSRCDRDALLKVADMLECDGECSECECGKGTFCEAPTIAAARIRKALGVES